MITPQEILNRQGYLIIARTTPAEIGEVLRIQRDDDLAPRGTELVVRETATLAEARRYAKQYGLCDPGAWPHFYKVIAE